MKGRVLQRFDQLAAARAIENLDLRERNRKLARYWLSIWTDGLPPPRSAISPAKIKDLLPGIAIFERRIDGNYYCRLAGSAISMGLGMDPTGLDIIAITPPDHRTARRERYENVLGGAISRARKLLRSRIGSVVEMEDIQFPLGGTTEEGSRQILYHADWRPKTLDRTRGEIVNGLDTAVDQFIPIIAQPISAAAG